MDITSPAAAAEALTRIGQQLLSIKQAHYHQGSGAVLIGQMPNQQQLDELGYQLADAEAVLKSATEVVRGLLRDVRQILETSPVDYAGRW